MKQKLPSEKTIAKKKQIVEALARKIAEATAGVVVDYKGITVAEDTKLRAEMREANVEYFVAKNTLLKLATKDTELAGLSEVLEGTTSVAVCRNDYVAAAKIVAKYAEELGERFNIKAGFADSKVLSVAEVNAFAKLPSREELVASALRGLNAPISGFANVLSANLRGLAVALNAIAEKKSA